MFWFISRKKVFHSAQNGFPAYIDLSIPGSLARELPAVVADTAKAEGVAIGRTEAEVSRLTRELPFGRTAADAVAAAREPGGRTAGVAREDKIFRPRNFPVYMDLSTPGSLARELPKAEGVAPQHAAMFPRCAPRAERDFPSLHRASIVATTPQKKYLLSLISYPLSII